MIQQPKPVPVNDLQGRLRCRCWSTEELITRQRRGFVLSICPSLALEREREKQKKRTLIAPSRSWILSFQIFLGDLLAAPRFIPTFRRRACLLSRNDIVNDNNASAYRAVSAAVAGEWRRKWEGEFVPVVVFGGTLVRGRVCRRKIRLILHITG